MVSSSLRRYLPLILPLTLILAAAPAFAADDASQLDTIAGGGAPGKYDQGFSGSAALGYTATTGNTDTSSLDAKFGIAYGAGQWYHVLSAEKIRATDKGVTTASSLQAEQQSDYLFTPNNYVFENIGYSHDDFAGVEQRTSEAIGYGRRILHTATQTWSAQIGVGARQEDIRDDGSRNSAIVQLASDYSWQFADNSSLGEGVVVEYGTNNTRIESATSLTVKIVKDFALVLSYTIKHNTNVPGQTANTDTYTAVSLQYTF
ncbi:MAG TPA: DUF481 domain-containing protein [Gammaproteobacteria bacterium]|nr:DUF481 domain-containing protein [Gammaproteobacteria bacterium]